MRIAYPSIILFNNLWRFTPEAWYTRYALSADLSDLVSRPCLSTDPTSVQQYTYNLPKDDS